MSEHNGAENREQPARRRLGAGGKTESRNLWLTPLQFAHRVHLSRSSVYRRIDEGDIPKEMLCYAGPRQILISPEAVPYCWALWKLRRYYGFNLAAPTLAQVQALIQALRHADRSAKD